MNAKQAIKNDLFTSDANHVAQELLGKFICRKFEDGTVRRWCITETEAYDEGESITYNSDIFCGTGKWCFYYGMLMINCKNEKGHDNVLIRATDCIKGPCNIGLELKIKDIMDEINSTDVLSNPVLWLEDWGVRAEPGDPRKRVGVQKKEEELSKAEKVKLEEAKKAEKNFFAESIDWLCFKEAQE